MAIAEHQLQDIEEPLAPALAEQARQAVNDLDRYLRAMGEGRERVVLRADDERGGDSTPLIVPAAALHLFRTVLAAMADGKAVTVLPIHALLTTQEAANLLNVSRPYLVKLIEEGKMPASKVGTHRRVRVEDLVAYRRRDAEQRRQLLDDLTAEAQELGLGYE